MEYRKLLTWGTAALVMAVTPAAVAYDCFNSSAGMRGMRGGPGRMGMMRMRGSQRGAMMRGNGGYCGMNRQMMVRNALPGLPAATAMNEDERAGFAELGGKLQNALEDFQEEDNERTRAAVRKSLSDLVGALQKFEIERSEKALARAKAKTKEQEEIVERAFKYLIPPEKAVDPETVSGEKE